MTVTPLRDDLMVQEQLPAKNLYTNLATHGCCDHAESNWAQACQTSPSFIPKQMAYTREFSCQ
jgi:hypothetical protein